MSQVCKNFAKGSCSYGQSCKFSHSRPSTLNSMETGPGIVKTNNPFATTTLQPITVDSSVSSLKEYIGRGCYALTSFGAVTGDVSPEELRWYGTQAVEAVTTREKVLGIALPGYKPMTQGQVTASRVYPSFVPRDQFTVISEELLKELKW